jgi:hypothetical protein
MFGAAKTPLPKNRGPQPQHRFELKGGLHLVGIGVDGQ